LCGKKDRLERVKIIIQKTITSDPPEGFSIELEPYSEDGELIMSSPAAHGELYKAQAFSPTGNSVSSILSLAKKNVFGFIMSCMVLDDWKNDHSIKDNIKAVDNMLGKLNAKSLIKKLPSATDSSWAIGTLAKIVKDSMRSRAQVRKDKEAARAKLNNRKMEYPSNYEKNELLYEAMLQNSMDSSLRDKKYNDPVIRAYLMKWLHDKFTSKRALWRKSGKPLYRRLPKDWFDKIKLDEATKETINFLKKLGHDTDNIV